MNRHTLLASTILVFGLLNLPIGAPAQTEDEMIEFYQTRTEALNAHDLDGWIADFSEDVVYDAVPSPPPMHGPQAAKEYVAGVIAGFPDFQDTPQRILASGNILAVIELYTGTHQAEWFGIPATGKVNRSLALVINEFQDGKLVRLTQYWNPFGMLVNLGVMPPPQLPEMVPSFDLPAPEPPGLDPVSAAQETETRWNAHDMVAYSKLFRDDAQLLINGLELDRTGYIAMQERYMAAFPDIEMDVTRHVDMGDGWVLTEAVLNATQDGPYFGVPPSGAKMVNRMGWIARYDDQGLVSYASFHWDDLNVLAQLGALPGSGSTAVQSASWAQIKAEAR